jgi:hypothetical protein
LDNQPKNVILQLGLNVDADLALLTQGTFAGSVGLGHRARAIGEKEKQCLGALVSFSVMA